MEETTRNNLSVPISRRNQPFLTQYDCLFRPSRRANDFAFPSLATWLDKEEYFRNRKERQHFSSKVLVPKTTKMYEASFLQLMQQCTWHLTALQFYPSAIGTGQVPPVSGSALQPAHAVPFVGFKTSWALQRIPARTPWRFTNQVSSQQERLGF